MIFSSILGAQRHLWTLMFRPLFWTCKKGCQNGVLKFGSEPLGSLKGTQYRHQNQVQGTRTQYKVRPGVGTRCEVQVRGAGAR